MTTDLPAVAAPDAASGLAPGVGSHHQVVVRPGARVLYVAFGTDAPNAAEAALDGPANVARFSDEGGDFGRGVPGYAPTLDAMFCLLRTLEPGLPTRLVGEGRGATVALLVGLVMPRASVLAINPVPFADEPGSLDHPFWGDAAAIAGPHPARQAGVCALSAWDVAGASVLARAEALPPAFGTVIELPCPGGGVAHLRRKKALAPLLQGGAGALRDLISAGAVGLRGTHGRPRQYAAFVEVAKAAAGGAGGRKRAMRLVEEHAGWENPGWQHLRSTVLRREGAPTDALAAARSAADAAPEAVTFVVAYARLVGETAAREERERAADLLQPHMRQRGIRELHASLTDAA